MLITLLLTVAWASPVYPGTLVTDLDMPCTPTCTICHETNSGGDGTVTRDFGLAMMEHGLTGGSATDLLATALDGMTTDAVDSDGDGTIDTEALAAGIDPNPGGAPFCDVVTPEYGCNTTGGAALPGLLGVLAGVGMLRRRAG